MPKITILRGFPASGKSTKAEEIMKASGNTVRLNKDLLRTMLHCDKFTGLNEGMTQDAQKLLAEHFIGKDKNVIIDDTNLNPITLNNWLMRATILGIKSEVIDLKVPVEECIARDAIREKKVGRHVIEKMAFQYEKYMMNQKVIICDLDGTLCDIEWRTSHVKGEKKDWKAFFGGIPDDKIRHDVLDMLRVHINNGCKVIFVTARPENYRLQTEKWLTENFPFPYSSLIMRMGNDKRKDTLVKAEIYDKYLKNLDIVAVYDDRPCIIEMWREKKLNVIDVGNGIEF